MSFSMPALPAISLLFGTPARTGQEDGVALQRIQNQSGCRLHIERSKSEVRLFGSKEAAAVADRLLDDFQKMCMERFIPCPNSSMLDLDRLNEMAQASGSTD